jgi:uncharacterized protein YndB with AHSA1/START domain
MATFENTVTIRRSPKDVFAFLANFENIPTWNYAISETKKTSPGPVGSGPPTASSAPSPAGARKASK